MILTKDELIGFAVLIIVIGGVAWYDLTRPPVANAPGIATSTAPVGTMASPMHITESAEFYTIDAQYPAALYHPGTALPPNFEAAGVNLMKQWETDTIAQFKSDSGLNTLTAQDIQMQHLGPDRKYSLAIAYQTYQSAHTVSYVYQIFADTLGAHPNTTYKTFTFDTTNGQNLSLAMLFNPGTNYLGWLSTYARAKLPAMIAARENVATLDDNSTSMLNEGTTADSSNFADFYLAGTNLVILFPPYAIGPYVLGSTTLDIPLSSIPGLKPEYQ